MLHIENGLYFGKTLAGELAMPTVTIRQSGNANIISLPKMLLEQMGASVGDRLQLSYHEGKILLQMPKAQKSLEEMLAGVTPDMFQTEEDRQWEAAKPVGNELW